MQVGVYTQPHLVAATSIHCSSRADSILCPLSSVFYTSRPSTIGFSTKVVHRLVRFPIAYLRSTCQELKQQTLFGIKLFHFQVFVYKKIVLKMQSNYFLLVWLKSFKTYDTLNAPKRNAIQYTCSTKVKPVYCSIEEKM